MYSDCGGCRAFHTSLLRMINESILSVRNLQIHSSKTLNIRRLPLMDKLLNFLLSLHIAF